jgi:hypothetical protein
MPIPDFIAEALDRAPMADPDDIDPEELAEVEQRAAEMRAGRAQRVPHAEVQEMIAAMRPLAG